MPIRPDVRFGSKADICSAKGHVRFTPESGHVQRTSHVCFVPIADIGRLRAFRQQRGYARQNNPDFGELARLRIDLD